MAYPTIVFNSSTGSDTAASGAGPAVAVTGTCAASASSTTVTFQGSPDLSGVATDGSAAIFISGIGFDRITAVDDVAKTVTIDTALTIGAGTAFAIGGKRATLNNTESRRLFAATVSPTASGIKGLWTVEIETDQTLTSLLSCTAASTLSTGFITIKGTGQTRPVINQSTDYQNIFSSISVSSLFVKWSFLKFTQSSVNKALAIGLGAGLNVFENCVFGDSTNKLSNAIARQGGAPGLVCYNCQFVYCTGVAITATSFGQYGSRIINCIFDSNQSAISSTIATVIMDSCIIANSTSDGIVLGNTGAGNNFIKNCTIHNNAGDGIDVSANLFSPNDVSVINCNITKNGGYGINAISGTQFMNLLHNNYGTGATANTSGAINNYSLGSGDIQVDPQYADAANGNYAIGANLKSKGYPKFDVPIGISSSTYSFVDIGAAQAKGGGARPVNIRGGADQ